MTLETYHKQNRVQKTLSSFIEPFVKDQDKIAKLRKAGIETYTPLMYRIKVGAYLVALGVSMFIPFTTSGLLIIGKRWLK